MIFDLIKTLLSTKQKKIKRSDFDLLEKEYCRAVALKDAGSIDEAIRIYEKLIKKSGDSAPLINEYAACLSQLGLQEEAYFYFKRALAIDENFAPALVNLAACLVDKYDTKQADELLSQARKSDSEAPFINVVKARIEIFRGNPIEASKEYLTAWLKDFENKKFAANYLFNLAYNYNSPEKNLTAEHVFWAQSLPASKSTPRPHSIRQETKSKIRIGYVSPDLREHSVRYFFRPLLENHDKDKFEVYAYYDSPQSDHQTQKIINFCDKFRNTSNLPDEVFCETIINDKIDILVDLCGHTSYTRIHLFKKRLSEVQITALGYPPTTGIETIDYKIVDYNTTPIGNEEYYAEKPKRLPGTFWCFNPMESTPEVSETPAIKNGFITFGCFGNIAKISPRILKNWQKIIKNTPHSKLIIKAITLQDEGAIEALTQKIKTAKIPLEQVTLEKPDPPEQFFTAYNRVDIILDTFPFNGGTTSCFSLWMGVPMITLYGEALISRMGKSMLSALKLDEFSCKTDETYCSKAIEMSADIKKLDSIRKKIRPKMLECSLANGKIYARDFESACIEMLQDKNRHVPNKAYSLSKAEIMKRNETISGNDKNSKNGPK
ncbi:O-linked N-acetylglucosamine transferase, SPINDLY family protein [Pseudomonas oryzihabitans]|uniref:O-linked N-acetylglucosamine transferase, SPINDLY family protein n=1 Tax=Pseudomonas oryzihabitans TaxID=47885 RepID=UPI00289F55F2|nr:hypothetical protein [Pseudomonas oryzihabitans]